MDYLERSRDFKGVWIPKEIWLDENLTTLEKIILIEVDSLDNEDHCVAGNDYLSQFCQCSEWKVSDAIKKLQKLGYIEVIAFDGRHRRLRSCISNLSHKNYEAEYGKPKDRLLEIQGQTLENPKAASGKPKAININNNIDNNLLINKGETSSPVVTKTTSLTKTTTKNDTTDADNYRKRKTIVSTPDPEEGQKKRVSRKEQLVNYVNELDYSEETKKALFSWIFQIGLNGNVTVQQLKDKLEYIWNIYHDESLVRQSIEEAYRNNWFGFFPLKSKPAFQQDKPKVEQKKADPTKIMDIVF